MAEGVPTYITIGSGSPVVCLHGGPGDSYNYLEPLAQLLGDRYHVILYNQRGSGDLPNLAENITLADLLAELEALRKALGQDQLTLIGHSWGATLALAYAATYPTHVAKMVLIGLGPLNSEWAAVAQANSLKPLQNYERQTTETLKYLRDEAISAQDWQTAHAIVFDQTSNIHIKSWFYDPDAAQTYLDLLKQAPPINLLTWRSIQKSLDSAWLWQQLPSLTHPTLIIYGYQDFEPITQAYELREHMPNVQICMINQAGHFPWMEQPTIVHQAIGDFLNP